MFHRTLPVNNLYKTIQYYTLVIEAPEHDISMSKFIICITVTGPPATTILCHTNKIDFLMVTPQKYKGLKNPDGVNRLYSRHLLVGIIWQLLFTECKDGPLVHYEQPIGIGVVGIHSVHTRYVIIVSLYLVFNLLTKIYCNFNFFFFLQNCCRGVPG